MLGSNRKRARSAQRRLGPKARPTASAPAPGLCVTAGFPFCVRYSPPMYICVMLIKKIEKFDLIKPGSVASILIRIYL